MLLAIRFNNDQRTTVYEADKYHRILAVYIDADGVRAIEAVDFFGFFVKLWFESDDQVIV